MSLRQLNGDHLRSLGNLQKELIGNCTYMYDMLWCAPRQAVVVKLFCLENFSNYPSKIFEVCTESQLDSLSLTTPRLGQHKQIKKEILCFYKFWRLLDRMGAGGKNKK